jgi:hypothetical protein
MPWGSVVELERKRRINLAFWAFAYEIMGKSLVDDATFDRECQLVDLTVDTGRPDLDAWFRKEFNPSTGLWIHDHPELKKVALMYQWRRHKYKTT